MLSFKKSKHLSKYSIYYHPISNLLVLVGNEHTRFLSVSNDSHLRIVQDGRDQ